MLLHAGGIGVGTAGIQMARAAAATVLVTAGTAPKLAACRELGASLAINYKQQDFVEAVNRATDGKGVDLILDPVGGVYIEKNLQALAENGRLVNISLLGGATGEMNMGLVLGKSLKLIGLRLRSRPWRKKSKSPVNLRSVSGICCSRKNCGRSLTRSSPFNAPRTPTIMSGRIVTRGR